MNYKKLFQQNRECDGLLIFFRGFNEENDNLRESLEGMCQRYEELKSIYQREEMSSRSLSDSHKDLSTRLLRAVRMLIDEKVARQSERCRLEVVTEEIEKLKAEKVLKNKILTISYCLKKVLDFYQRWRNYITHF